MNDVRSNLSQSLALCWLLISVGCTPPPSEYTVEYYLANDTQREAKIQECSNDPGSLRNDPLCINAQKAGALSGISSLRNPPAMTLLEAQERRERERREGK
jgi:hypothetical protein